MGIIGQRDRKDSRASGLLPRRASFVHSPASNATEIPIERANHGSPPEGLEPSLYGGSSYRTPTRSFYHRSFNAPADPAHYSSDGLREQTAELASLALSLPQERTALPPSLDLFRSSRQSDGALSLSISTASAIPGKLAPDDSEPIHPATGSSALTQMIRSPSSSSSENQSDHCGRDLGRNNMDDTESDLEDNQEFNTERTSLLSRRTRSKSLSGYGIANDIESQEVQGHRGPPVNASGNARFVLTRGFCTLANPKSWDRRAIWRQGVVYPVSLLPSVFLGLLLNILDALSYGMILFPLGEPIFSELGSDGISMFYVSTVIAQLVFSCGGSIFRGGIGSEMIEVVPFFHQMAMTILARVGEDNPKSVLATTILAYSTSSVLTGLVFFLMGTCRLGSLIGFFPRHILIGCIGGVGFFLLQTGVEVSARLSGSLEYNIPTMQKLFQLDTVLLWTIPLFLAVAFLVLKRFVRSNFLVGAYFIAVAVVFYVVKFSARVPMDTLRRSGWVFDAPSSSNPWYHFYTLYDFSAVNWSAFADTVPAMFALTFFGVLHVPINVPALGISTGEDNLNVDRELIAHGVTNALSGFTGSIQNYLVYTNSLLFIASGGNSRLAGIMLAFATMGILVVGPVIVGYIPVMVVGALIFMLGIELMEEALVDTWGKLHRLEYLTVVIIVATMGAWDFVVGIFVGILLACVSFVVQTSRKSAIRATFSGKITGSTVRRPPIQQRFLNEAGQQTLIIKLAGYLFFGTIVNVESTMRGLIEEEAFNRRPIRFLILDFSRVYGLDFSAAEAFTRINRILRRRHVQMTISGLDVESDVGRGLQNVGLFGSETGVQIFEDLNSALEFCENDYLKVFYSHREALNSAGSGSSQYLEVPASQHQLQSADGIVGSPRRLYLQQAATTTLQEDETAAATSATWSAMRQPLPLLLQTFQGLSSQNEDFWFRACSYFIRNCYAAGTVLFQKGDMPQAFYLLESGMLRAEYELPQGRYFELIVAGRPCGELPFFSETPRTATVKAEQDCVTWCLNLEKWHELKAQEPDIAQELLTVSLKLTTERMDSITS
ncbi:sulfate transporter family protein [Aspergillus clavatus NRRL 1]|uniref:Sulfate transporter family protein n=1 Tax=Aspergillus clavatus (strain ATCC 1007 / CBS 513.65 / DSM 816 / NCTC 3887 / NRRL 1 / QM 1276 / 107) TaxID=344612 RepID=A1CIG6_ASPCL|nr:sulfate transporter family protein [Aspergillus clavatus NRRL 1]EAW10671.1 sulfate transporter family protein [Aspergillus clavatus NRRL 1]